MPISELPTMTKGRGGPRYVRVEAADPQPCHTCRRTIPAGETSAIDRVRAFGRPPRRWCQACWDDDPQPQVYR